MFFDYLIDFLDDIDEREVVIESIWSVYFYLRSEKDKSKRVEDLEKRGILDQIVVLGKMKDPRIRIPVLKIFSELTISLHSRFEFLFNEEIRSVFVESLKSKLSDVNREALIAVGRAVETSQAVCQDLFIEDIIDKVIYFAESGKNIELKSVAVFCLGAYISHQLFDISEELIYRRKIIDIVFNCIATENKELTLESLDLLNELFLFSENFYPDQQNLILSYLKKNHLLSFLERLLFVGSDEIVEKVNAIYERFIESYAEEIEEEKIITQW